MRTKVALVVVSILLAWETLALARVENERYALTLGMCWDRTIGVADPKCLQEVETRTSWVWHVVYGLGVL